MISSTEAMYKLDKMLPSNSTILDIGSGEGIHASWFEDRGFDVTTNDIYWDSDYKCSFRELADAVRIDKELYGNSPSLEQHEWDCTWASHILEHQLNVHDFLVDMAGLTREGGLMAITVPPRKDNLVGGHLNMFTPLSLIYNIILAGVDCSEACCLYYGYNISVIVEKRSIVLPSLKYDRGDIEALADYFPIPVKQNTNGFKFHDINW